MYSVMPTLPLLAGDLSFFASSPALPLWYINLPLFTSTINIEYLAKNKTDLKIISSIRILIVCTSCKTSYNVLSHSHWGLGQFFGEVVEIPGGK